jgi:heptosyltransferase-2
LANALRRSGVGRVISWPAKPEPGRHITDHLLGALEGTGIGTTTHQPSLRPQGAWTTAARAWLDERGVGGGFAAIHPGSGGKAKRWPVERFAEVARALPCPTLWLLGPAEEEDAATRAIGEQVGVVADRLPLPSLAGLLALCRAYVGNDSGATHLAAAVGAPTLALFGPTDPAVWAPRGERVTVLGGPQAAGFEGLSVQKVLQKLPARLTT